MLAEPIRRRTIADESVTFYIFFENKYPSTSVFEKPLI